MTKSALIFHGGWDGHEPKACAALFARELSAHGFSVTVSNTLSVLEDAAALDRVSLVVPIWTMGTISENQEKNLTAAVLRGCGLAGFHGGMGDAFRGAIGYQWMVGGQFVSHPDNIKPYRVRVVNRSDEITRGIEDFDVVTEQYYMLVDPRNEVLAVTTMQSTSATWTNGVEMPVVWKKRHGEGRIFYSALGHQAAEFERTPQQLQLTVRGMLWAAR